MLPINKITKGKCTWNRCGDYAPHVLSTNSGTRYACDGHLHSYLNSSMHASVIGEYYGPEQVAVNPARENTMPVPVILPRTQKAKGIFALRESYKSNCPSATLIDPTTITAEQLNFLVGKFVRPCPMRPRHGFVDSRFIPDLEQAGKIVAETLAADPEGELIVMNKVDADYSGIWTPGSLAIGKGNDGATAGTSAFTLPVIGDVVQNQSVLTAAGIHNAPYLELLWEPKDYTDEKYTTRQVQLRDGPTIPQTLDYIPEKITVKNVIVAEGDLLEWEAKMKNVPEGTVVYHPHGSLASHYAIHAVLNKVPVLISREPKVGDVLTVSESDTRAIDLTALRAGFFAGVHHPLTFTQAAYLMLAGVHHIALWKGKHDFLLGAAAGVAYRLTAIAAFGEMRHLNQRKAERDRVYSRGWNRTLTSPSKTRLVGALEAFMNRQWPSRSFGGYSWYKFVRWAAVIYNALLTGDGEKSLEAFNQLVHSAHNTGWGFNKFIPNAILDKSAANPVETLVQIAPVIYQLSESIPAQAQLAQKFLGTRRPAEALDIPEDKYAKRQAELEAARAAAKAAEGKPALTKTDAPYDGSPVTYAQGKVVGTKLHVQYTTASDKENYHTIDFPLDAGTIEAINIQAPIFNALKKSLGTKPGKSITPTYIKLTVSVNYHHVLLMSRRFDITTGKQVF